MNAITDRKFPAEIGDNSGSVIPDVLRKLETCEKEAPAYLASEHAQLMTRLAEIKDKLGKLPARCDDKETGAWLSDVRFALRKWVTAAKSARTQEKRPFDAVAKVFYNFFTKPIDDLEEIDEKALRPIIEDWNDREEARKRREADEEARRLREEADRRAREAAEAEARKVAAERAEREAKAAAEEAERRRIAEKEAEARAKAQKEEQERQAAEAAKRAAAAAKERAEQERLAAEARKRREADEAASAAAREVEEAANRRALEARQREEAADEQRRINEEAARKAREEELAAKDRAAAAKTEQTEAERAQVGARKEQRTAKREETAALDDAMRHEKKADKQDDIAEGSAASLTRIRGDAGSVSSKRVFKNFRNVERAKLDLEALRQHITLSAYETAIQSFIDAGGTELRGVEIFDDSTVATR